MYVCLYTYVFIYVSMLFMYVCVCMSAVYTVRTVQTKAIRHSPAGWQNTINSARHFLFAETSQRCQSDTESV